MADFLLPWDVIREVPASEYSSRDGATPSMHIWHHGATTSGWAIEANMEPGGRELSATGVIHNDGTAVGKVPEWARAWTSGSYRFDRIAITTEMANGAVDGWTITDATYAACARIAAAEYRIYGIPLDRDHHVGHNELYSEKYGWESYPTYCPGPPERVDWIVELARRTLSGTAGGGYTPIEEEEDTMKPRQIHYTDAATGRVIRALLVPGTGYFVKWTESGSAYANGIAKNMETGTSTEVTGSLFAVFQAEAAAQRPKGALEIDLADTEA